MSIYWPINEVSIIKNIYWRSYCELITRAQSRSLDKSIYVETHHIIPRCFYIKNKNSGWIVGNPNTSKNLVQLTAKEHYLAHRFLTRFVSNDLARYKMLYALDALGMKCKRTDARYRMPALVYEQNKLEIHKIGHSEETKRKIGLANKGRKPHNTGKHRSDETRKKISDSRLKSKKCRGYTINQDSLDERGKTVSKLLWIINDNGKRLRVTVDQLPHYFTLGYHQGRGNIVMKSRGPQSDETKEKRSQAMKTLMWINNPASSERKRVTPDNLNDFLIQGWIVGKN